MNATFAVALKKVCPPPRNGGGFISVSNNRVTDPNKLSNQFYHNVISGQVLFTSDQTLMDQTPKTGNKTAVMVADNAANPIARMARFAAALVKMVGIEVLTGTDPGEVRKVCFATNSAI